MKKTIIFLLAFQLLGMTFTSCQKEKEPEQPGTGGPVTLSELTGTRWIHHWSRVIAIPEYDTFMLRFDGVLDFIGDGSGMMIYYWFPEGSQDVETIEYTFDGLQGHIDFLSSNNPYFEPYEWDFLYNADSDALVVPRMDDSLYFKRVDK